MYIPFQTNQAKCINIPHFRPDWFENYTLKGGSYPYGHLRRIPTPVSRSFSPYRLLSVNDFFVQKYLVDYQLLLQRSLQILNCLANKENKVPFEESKKTHTPPKLCIKARATAPWNRWAKAPANKLIMRLAMKLASFFVIYFCSLFCLLVGLRRAQNTRNIEMQQLMNN